ncbi:MAG: molybdate ABC transporter substrate-binding protein [Timaviella obliquedivisa GSE-PSE-MK23-08B]|jgi:molybdate transport system substrate-binding protein|nr:molybdate ABC transporter substrate-binding protein [Timaviella obliquedivisa GSE-PSE-MK23-08B]
MKRSRLAFLGIIFVGLAIALSWRSMMPTPASNLVQTSLLISAAASLNDSLKEIKPLYQARNPSISLTYNLGASGALLQQIQNGAPADIFISAAKQQMDILEKSGELLSETRSDLVKNRLALIVPTNSQVVTNFSSLQNSAVKRISVGEPRSVPAGQYAKQVLQRLKLYDLLKPKFVYANNVRQVLAAVESGNAESGIAYLTDAKILDKVKVAVLAAETDHDPIVYPIAVLKSSKNPQAAREFVQFLESDQAQLVFKKHGFIVPK